MTTSVIVAGARTPIGKLQGSLAGFPAVELGAIAIRAALERAGVAPDAVDYVIMGHVLQAGAGQITARQAAIGAGLPVEIPAITVNKVCLSGLSAVAMADQMIRAGEIEIAVAGGMESMTNAPFLIPKARAGSRLGDAPMLDAMIHDGLWSTFMEHHMVKEPTRSARSSGSGAGSRMRGPPGRTGERLRRGTKIDSPRRSCRSMCLNPRAIRFGSTATRASVPIRLRRHSRD